MREIVLVMPTGGRCTKECGRLSTRLAEVFGGYSAYEGHGVWKDEKGTLILEGHTRFIVAVGDRYDGEVAIDLLMTAAREAGEHSIYYVDFDGEAHVEKVERKREAEVSA